MIATLSKGLFSKLRPINLIGWVIFTVFFISCCLFYSFNPRNIQNINLLDLKWSTVLDGELIIENQLSLNKDLGKDLLQLVTNSNKSKILSCFITYNDGHFSLLRNFDLTNQAFLQDSLKNASSVHFKRKSLDDVWEFACMSLKSDYNFSFTEAISQKFYPDDINLNFVQANSCNKAKEKVSKLCLNKIGSISSPYLVPHFGSLNAWESEFARLQKNANVDVNFDSLLMIIKDSEDISYKYKGDKNELYSNLKNLSFSGKSASVYLFLTDNEKDKYFTIFTFGSDRFLNLENPALIQSTFQIEPSNLVCSKYRYAPSTYFFSWGNIALSIKQDEKGNFKAKSSVPYSTWYDAMGQAPNLMLNKGDSIVDEFSVQVKLENEFDAFISGVDLGKFYSREIKLNSFLGKKEAMADIKQKTIGSTIHLSDFVFFNEIKEHIDLEIAITEDKILQPKKRFQFNWKHIDTVITKASEEKDYELFMNMRKTEFLECLPFEPVLTSSTDGVIWNFSFDILKQEDQEQLIFENVTCSLKDPKLYKGTEYITKFQNIIHPNNVVILRNFKADEIEENLTIYITIEEDLDEVKELAKEIYIDWGNSKFKATDLSSDKTKKFYSEQIITREKLLKITSEDIYLIRNGKKEIVDQADLVITNDMEVKSCKKDKAWIYCLDKLISAAKLGDHVNIFLRSNSGQSALMQFYIERADSEADILGYGIQSDFDSLLFKYAEPIYKKEKSKLSNYKLKWGDDKSVPLKLMGNPNVYGGSTNMLLQDFMNKIGDEFIVTSETLSNIQLTDVHFYIYFSTFRRPMMLRLDCANGVCSLNPESIEELLEESEGVITYARLFINEYEDQDLDGKVKSFDFVLENPEGPWIPKQRLDRIVNLEEKFDFQFVYDYNGKSILKLDLENPDYKWMVEKYKTNPNVQIMNFPNFKTISRTVNENEGIVKKENIKHVEVLSDHFESGHKYPDFTDFQNSKPELIWKSYLSTRGAETICLEDFICSEGGLQLSINNKLLKIFRGELLIVGDNDKSIKYVFDDINDFEIEKRLKTIKENSSLYFTNLLVQLENGELRRFPLSFAYHLE